MGDGDVGRVRAVVDAGPLIHLGEIGALSLLSAVDDLVVPETVIHELEEGGLPEGLTGLEYETRSVEETSARFENLDAGERAALELVTRAGDEYVLLTDDLAARETATEEGIEVHGSVGIVVLAYRRGIVDYDSSVSYMWALHEKASLFVTAAVVERGIGILERYRED